MINIVRKIGLFFAGVLFLACNSGPVPAPAVPSDELDIAIRETSDYLNVQLPKGNKLVILNIQSDFPALSEYIIDELIANTVNDRVFSVVDRRQLDTIRAELDFQMSGEVSDETAQSVGQMTGAQTIISGAVSRIGDIYRLRVRALNVQSAQIEGQFNRNIPDGTTVAALVQSKATGYGESSGGRPSAASAPVAPAPAPAAILVQAEPTPAPVAPAPTVYKVGDKGPGGGIVFYVSEAGFTLTADGTTCHYLEAALADLGSMAWAASDARSTNITGTAVAVGAGKRNTDLILAADANSPVANACKGYAGGGKNDWFLPSMSELTQLYNNRDVIGGFAIDYLYGYYWSSSQDSREKALYLLFANGGQSSQTKDNGFKVRPIRAF